MRHLFYRKMFEDGADKDTLIRSLLTELKLAEEQNARLQAIRRQNNEEWICNGQPHRDYNDGWK